MNPSRLGAILLAIILGAAAAATTAAAQTAARSLDYGIDPLVRSPRLLGMGRLELADDPHNRINLWDFAGSPTGIVHADTFSVLEYRPATQSNSALRDQGPDATERQFFDSHQVRNAFETWVRPATPSGTAYGLIGDITTLQEGRPFNDQSEVRNNFILPSATGVVNGRLPWVSSNKFDYALRISYGHEGADHLYYEMYNVPQGQYLGFPTASVNPPDLFAPDRVDVATLSFGGAVAMRAARDLTLALGYDHGRSKIASGNQGIRSSSSTEERRPFDLIQGSAIAKIGKSFELGLDARGWQSSSEETFNWTVSAGQSQDPLSGAGKRLDRSEQGSLLRARGRYLIGAFELGASLNTSYRRLEITPWYPYAPDDPLGFNDFLDQVALRAGADTLMLPKRVVATHTRENGRAAAGGLTWHIPGGRGLLGGEYHYSRNTLTDRSVGTGPEPSSWEVRAGGEYRLSPAFQARAGWGYGLSDQDNLTDYNTWRHTTATVGFGCRPMAARWSVDLGYAFEWLYPDYVAPTRPRETRQNLALQAHWPF